MGRSTEKETWLSEQRKYWSWAAQQKLEIVLAGCVAAGAFVRSAGSTGSRRRCTTAGAISCSRQAERFAGKEERQGKRVLRRKIAELERALGRKTHELEIAKALAGWE
jgi:transposase